MEKEQMVEVFKEQFKIYASMAKHYPSHRHRSIIKAKIDALNAIAKKLGLEIYFGL